MLIIFCFSLFHDEKLLIRTVASTFLTLLPVVCFFSTLISPTNIPYYIRIKALALLTYTSMWTISFDLSLQYYLINVYSDFFFHLLLICFLYFVLLSSISFYHQSDVGLVQLKPPRINTDLALVDFLGDVFSHTKLKINTLYLEQMLSPWVTYCCISTQSKENLN